VTTVSRPLLQLMKKAGCYHLKYGVETASIEILKDIHKTQSLKESIDAIKNTHIARIESHVSMIINFPNESIESIQKSIKFAIILNPTYAMFSILKPLPGSEIFTIADRENTLKHKNWELYGKEDPPVLKNQLGEEIIRKLVRDAYNSVYLNPRYIIMRIEDLIHEFNFKKIRRLIEGFLAFLPSKK
jgi:anaerobic magnesium-protoporphyrin IX monomethyl ester cyclase